jgi:hypothetical protein
MGVYASYFSGVNKTTREFNIASRAINTYGMGEALEHSFNTEDSPWIMIDSLSDGRNNSQAGADMHGSHFSALYHRSTQRIVIAMPGMEYDYSLQDTLDDVSQLITGSRAQTNALKAYAENIEQDMSKGKIRDKNGKALPLAHSKPIIASHSMGSVPIHVMTLAGYETFMLEPRPLTNGYLSHVAGLHAQLYKKDSPKTAEQALEALDQRSASLRAAHANIWNTPLNPFTLVHNIRNSYAYGTGNKATFSDYHLAGDHAAEVAVPSIVSQYKEGSAAEKAPKAKSQMKVAKIRR